MKRTLVTVLVVVALVVLLLFALHRYALAQFDRAYDAYAETAQRHQNAALIPALEANPLRRDLNVALVNVLQDNASKTERLKDASAGLALLVLADGGLDAIGTTGEDMQKALFELENTIGWWSLWAMNDMREIITLAQTRADMIADIRGLSYRANHQTKEIFDRIIVDGGTLTPAHATALNDILPSVEEQFDRRSNLYSDLERIKNAIDSTHSDVKHMW